jgi:hypothetical protein
MRHGLLRIEERPRYARELLAMDRPTEKATVWLLTTGWKRHGLLRFDGPSSSDTRCCGSTGA